MPKNFRQMFDESLLLSDLHYAVNICLLLGDRRSVIYLQECDFISSNGETSSKYQEFVDWLQSLKEIKTSPYLFGYLLSKKAIDTCSIQTATDLGSLLEYECSGEVDGSWIMSIKGSYQDLTKDIIVQKCHYITEERRRYNEKRAQKIQSFLAHYHIGVDLHSYIQQVLDESVIKQALIDGKVSPLVLREVSNYLWNWGFSSSVRKIEALLLKEMPPSKEDCLRWLEYLSFIEERRYNISDFNTRQEFNEHHRAYQVTVRNLEKSLQTSVSLPPSSSPFSSLSSSPSSPPSSSSPSSPIC